MSYNRERELEAYPKYKAAYLRAFGRMLEERKRRGKDDDARHFTSPEGVMNWYLEKATEPEQPIDGQVDVTSLMEVNDE